MQRREEGGVGTLADDQIAKATAANGYNQASESWNPEKPEAGITQFTEDTHYTISFAENAAVEIRYVPENAEHGTTTNNPDSVNPGNGYAKGLHSDSRDRIRFQELDEGRSGGKLECRAEARGHREGGRPVCGIRIRSELRSG